MLIPCKIHVIARTNDIPNLFAVYTHKDINGIVQYVGTAPLSDLLSHADAQCNSVWPDVFTRDPNTFIELEVVGLTDSEAEAKREQLRLVTAHNPQCNRRGYYTVPDLQSVICNETGEIFRNIKTAAIAHNVSYSQLYNHIKRKPGHKFVKGRTYSRTVKRQ